MLDSVSDSWFSHYPIWGSETDSDCQQMWRQMFAGAAVYPDAFRDIPDNVPSPTYLTSGFDCPDYSPRGSNLGMWGETGWKYVKQVSLIIRIRPKAFRLEQTAMCKI